jgi:Tfp pilus assembly protein PilV
MMTLGHVPRMARADLHGVLADEAGFSLAEIIAAAAILTIAVVALFSSITAGFASVDVGRQQSAAVFLAEQRLEDARAFAISTAAGQGLASLTSATFPEEGYGTIASAPGFRRTITVTDQPAGIAATKLIEVTVFYRTQTESGWSAETSVGVATLVAQR